ncbi:hypothetical protein HKX48_007727 [Thoreauomyces humboldtii]|nr:hypothetical protein HKX48_007727 [Thoreauomyces humboldtii]
MARPVEHTVLVTVLEGEHFLRKPRSKLYVQCRFNNEILTTDPVDHVAHPVFDTELAWDIDGKALGFFRSQRASLKLVVYAVSGTARDPVGYIMLDLRGAPARPTEGWWPLVNARYAGAFRPELKISFAVVAKGKSLEDGDEDEESIAFDAKGKRSSRGLANPPKPPPTKPRPTGSPDKGSSLLGTFSIPVKLHPEGFYQIGNDDGEGKMWVLGITVAFAEHLELLSPDATSGRYTFAFTFLGTLISTESFTVLRTPVFPAERVSIRLRGTRANVQTFIDEMTALRVHLRSGGDDDEERSSTLGFADVALRDLRGDFNVFTTVEKMYTLYTPDHELCMSDDARVPAIGVALSLAVDDAPDEPEADYPLRDTSFAMSAAPVRAATPEDDGAGADMSVISRPHSPPIPAVPAAAAAQRASSRDPAAELPLWNAPRPREPEQSKKAEIPADWTRRTVVPPSTRVPTNGDEGWHQYRFSIDLRSLLGLSRKSATVYMRYTYPAFGTVVPTTTQPPLAIGPSGPGTTTTGGGNEEILLPHSFCAFEFVMAPRRLKELLTDVPLCVEMWEKDTFLRDQRLGVAEVHMLSVWDAKPTTPPSTNNPTTTQSIRSLEMLEPIVDTQLRRLADLRVILALEDFGSVEQGPVEPTPVAPPRERKEGRSGVVTGTHSRQSSNDPNKPHPPPHAISTPAVPSLSRPRPVGSVATTGSSTGTTPIHATAEYQAALELEIWRSEEERRFRAHLRQRETAVLDQLATEWAAREREREETLAKKAAGFTQVEGRLQELAKQLERRDGEVAEREREATRRVDEARDAARRVAEECRHRATLDARKVAEAVRERDAARQELLDAKAEVAAVTAKQQRYPSPPFPPPPSTTKKATTASDERTMEDQVATLTRKLADEKRSKRYYKTAWARALRELAAARTRWTMDLERRLADREADDEGRHHHQHHHRRSGTAVNNLATTTTTTTNDQRRRRRSSSSSPSPQPAPPPHTSSPPPHSSRSPHRKSRDKTTENRVRLNALQTELDELKLARSLSRSQNERASSSTTTLRLHPDEAREEAERLTRERDSLLRSGVYTKSDRLVRELERRIERFSRNDDADPMVV